MLRNLKDLLESLMAPVTAPSGAALAAQGLLPRASAKGSAAEEHRLQLATAVLLTEVMCASDDVNQAERDAVIPLLRRKFSLTADEVARLLELAAQTQRQATDFHQFTSALNDHLDHAQKVRVIESMWEVAYADGDLASHENHVLWRVADLLHVPHGAYINAKIRAKAAAGL
jgi:uncharacterized tellurite resistance protein B-like protein